MISVIIGGYKGDLVFDKLREGLPKSDVLVAGQPGTFAEFCKRAIKSTNIISIKNIFDETTVDKVANDDMIVLLCNKYIDETRTPVLYKLATVIETGVDLGLDIQVFSLIDEKEWNRYDWDWPHHWPTIQDFYL